MGLAADYCEGSDTDTLVGGPAGGFFLAGPGLTILAAGDSAIFDPALAGAYDAKYYFTDVSGCTDTATVSTVVNSLPVVSVTGLAADYCEGSDTDTLVGGPGGGFFLAGPGLTILGAATVQSLILHWRVPMMQNIISPMSQAVPIRLLFQRL